MIDSQNGWVAGSNGLILKTTDGGKHWKKHNAGMEFTEETDDLFFINKNTGWILSDRYLYRTDDAGKNWHRQKLLRKIASGHGNKLCVIDENLIFILTDNSMYIWAPTEGGEGWDRLLIKAYVSNAELIDMHQSRTGEIRILAVQPTSIFILKSIDKCKTFEKIVCNLPIGNHYDIYNLKEMWFFDSTTGWIILSDSILKTTDGGKTWKRQKSGTINPLNRVFFINKNTGWIVGNFGTILRTETGGD
jgi:photosystem II stability/assembly factor-like uncharacterized protein